MANGKLGFSLALTLVVSFGLGGCGLAVPEKSIFNEDVPNETTHMPPQGSLEEGIIAKIRCELGYGILNALTLPNVDWLRSWGTTVTLKLTVDEKGSLSPNATFAQFLNKTETFVLGASASGSADATRVENIAFNLSNDVLIEEARAQIDAGNATCRHLQNGLQVEGNLKIGQFIYDKAYIASTYITNTSHPVGSPYTVLSDDITFVLTFGGGMTPTWKLTYVGVNPAAPFVSGSRAQTDEVIISMGKITKPATKNTPIQLSIDVQNINNAALIGSATSTAIQTQVQNTTLQVQIPTP
jgi:hypothetical protein